MKITMIGTGYVGLVSGACFADFGHDVTCVDTHARKIDTLRSGKIPIFEPGLKSLVAENVEAGRLSFTTDLAPSVAEADVVFIAVGTPQRHGGGAADMSHVHGAAAQIAKAMSGYTVVVTKSTVPVGEGDEVERIIRATNPDADFSVVSNPEFLREGAAIEDFKRPDRIVIGTDDERARAAMTEVYRPLYLNQAPLHFTGRRSAEIIKYAANAFLAMKVTFINEIADLCEAAGGDVQQVARGIGLDNRIGRTFLNAGPGYGGSCFPKDTRALATTARDQGSPLRLVETTIAVNDERMARMGQKVIRACGGSVKGMRVAVLGLTFKPNTDDMREAPSIGIINTLVEAGATVTAFDPHGMDAARQSMPDINYASNAYKAAERADCVVIVTEWNAFRSLDLERLKSVMNTALLVDLRNIYRRKDVVSHGFQYEDVGRAS